MSASIAKVVGTPNKNSWSQIHTFAPEDQTELKKYGQLIAAIALISDEGSTSENPSVDMGHTVLTTLQEAYFNNTGVTSPHENLKLSVEKVAESFPNISLEVVACVVWGKYIYFCVWGGGKVVLWRNGAISTIISARPGLSGRSSGIWQEGDTFVLGTETFFDVLSKQTIAEHLANGLSPQDLVDNLAPIAHRVAKPTLSGAIFKPVLSTVWQSAEPEENIDSTVSETFENIEETEKLQTIEKPVEMPVYEERTIKFDKRPFGSEPKTLFRSLLVKFAMKLPEQSFVAKGEKQSNRKTMISVGIVLLVLLGASILFGIQQKKTQVFKSSYTSDLTEAKTYYDDAILQKDINPPHARELFLKAKTLVDDMTSRGVEDQELTLLKEKIDTEQGNLLGKVDAKPVSILDLSLVRTNVAGEELILNGNTLSIFDAQGKRVIATQIDGKETAVLGGEEKLGSVKTLASGDLYYYLLSDKGVVQLAKSGATEVVAENSSDWGEIVKIGSFGSNVYLLDRSNNQIWRLAATEKGFSNSQAWLKEENISLGGATDFVIDGSLWVLLTGGEIKKFTRGTEENFAISGFDGTLSSLDAFYTDSELELIFALDAQNKRILEFTKTGEYRKQYQAEEIGEAKDLVVSKDANKIYILANNKVLSIEVK